MLMTIDGAALWLELSGGKKRLVYTLRGLPMLIATTTRILMPGHKSDTDSVLEQVLKSVVITSVHDP